MRSEIFSGIHAAFTGLLTPKSQTLAGPLILSTYYFHALPFACANIHICSWKLHRQADDNLGKKKKKDLPIQHAPMREETHTFSA